MKEIHPEQKADEVFVGNTDERGLSDKFDTISSARLGLYAYDMYGHRLDSTYRPIFIKKIEEPIYDRIMNAKLKAIIEGR